MEPTLTAAWMIELSSDGPVARLAAEELRLHLALLGAPELPIVAVASGLRIALRHGLAGDGFLRAPDEHGLVLRGDGPRGLLYAVYDLLEALGWRWPAPEPTPLRPPRRAHVVLPTLAYADRPGLPVRSLIIGHDHFLEQAERWISWAARNRLNTIFIHTTIREPALGACRLPYWRSRRRTLLPLLRERGMRIEIGGHHLRDLLPRRLFSREPTLFRHDGLRRTPDHNLCVSNPRALERLRRIGSAFFQAYPEAEVYHLWPDDLRAGGWCHCRHCAALSPADQAMTAANALAEALAALRPEAQLSYLAYHDTEAPPERVSPHAALRMLFAPRTRSYAAGIGAAANAAVAAHLAQTRTSFVKAASNSATGADLGVFEYYLDGILFKSSPPPLASVIAADLAYYRAAGVGAAHVLLTGDRPFAWAPLNAYLFARLAWAPASDPTALVADYAAARSPELATPLAQAYAALEAAWQPALMRDPGLPPPAHSAITRDPVGRPPADILDTMGEPRLNLEQRLEAMRLAEAYLAQGREAWATLLAAGPAAAHLADEQAEWELAAHLLAFLRLRQQLYVLDARAASQAALSETLTAAQAALDTLLAWAERHVPPKARAGHLLLRSAFQLQLDHIADRRLLRPLARLGLRARRAGDLAKLLPWLVR